MTERFVVNALNYCVKLVGNKIGKEKHYKILLELIVSNYVTMEVSHTAFKCKFVLRIIRKYFKFLSAVLKSELIHIILY